MSTNGRGRLLGVAAGSLIGILAAGPLSGQTAATFARLQSWNIVEVLDLKKNAWRQVYKADAWNTSELSVAPSGDRLALLAWAPGVIEGQGYKTPPAPALIVIDLQGRLLAPPVARVQRYTWCGRDCLAYVTGSYEENDIGFIPQDVGVLNVATGRTTQLPKPTTPIGITWAAFDGAVYVKNLPRQGEAEVYRLDIAGGRLDPTPFRDNMFSPTGKYYLERPEFADSLVVYETANNAPVDLSQLRRNAKLLGWASAKEDVLLTAPREPGNQVRGGPPYRAQEAGEKKPETTYKLYDIRTKRVRETVSGHVDGWVGRDHQRLVRQGGSYKVLGPE